MGAQPSGGTVKGKAMRIPEGVVGKGMQRPDGKDESAPPTEGRATPRCGMALAQAAELARTGRYDEAECALAGAGEDPGLKSKVLDLRARILAQRGRYVEAEACWLEALQLEPGNSDYRAALDALARNRRSPVWLRLVVNGALIAVAAAVVVYIVETGARDMRERQRVLAEQVAAVQQEQQTGRRETLEAFENLRRQIEAVEARLLQHILELRGDPRALGRAEPAEPGGGKPGMASGGAGVRQPCETAAAVLHEGIDAPQAEKGPGVALESGRG